MERWKLVLMSALGLLLVILIIQNTEVVTVNFLFWDFQMSRVILILLAAVTGFVGGYIVARITGPRRQSQSAPPGTGGE